MRRFRACDVTEASMWLRGDAQEGGSGRKMNDSRENGTTNIPQSIRDVITLPTPSHAQRQQLNSRDE